jgi:hypothetical protein
LQELVEHLLLGLPEQREPQLLVALTLVAGFLAEDDDPHLAAVHRATVFLHHERPGGELEMSDLGPTGIEPGDLQAGATVGISVSAT